jgi:hypothetical protein
VKRVLFPYYAHQAAHYDFYLDEKHQQRLELQERPVLTWTNAENYMGAVFVWTFQGRPEMIGCIGSHQYKAAASNVFHEFHSLSLQPLPTLKLGRGKEWTPAKPGVTMAPLDGAPLPEGSERLRLTQMRNLAREFRGWMKDNDDVTELRLLPQPIMRYQAPEREVIDGAIFALVWKGTDPEVLLLVEDRREKPGERWHYALARFNFREMWVKRGDKEVWRVGVERNSDIYLTSVLGEVSLDAIRAATPKTKQKSPPKM